MRWKKRWTWRWVRCQAFFYSTWWFIGLLALAVAAVVFFLYQAYASRRLAVEKTRNLQSLDDLKSRLYANITHEFRTPLTLILGPVQKLLRKPDKVSTGELVASLSLVETNGQRLLNLVNQMLDLQKLEARQLQPQFEQGDVAALLRYLTDSFHSLAEAKNLSLQFSAEPASLVMDFDKDKLLKIAANLISNAIKFTPPGGSVSVSATQSGERFLLEVSDTGIGIGQADLPKIFNLFYQSDNSLTRSGQGTGIGLTLVKELVELLGSGIGVESEVGKGTKFQVSLPFTANSTSSAVSSSVGNSISNSVPFLPPTANSTSSAVSSTLSMLSPTPVSTSSADRSEENGHAPLVLIIEDNPDVAQFIAACLSQNYRVEHAFDGKAGMERALELMPDLVVSDVMMPEADGFEVCRFLKNDGRTSHIPVVLLTARAEIRDRLEGLRRGADAYLAKPFYEEELLITVEKLLRLRRVLRKRYAGLTVPEEQASEGVTSSAPLTSGSFDLRLEDAFMEKVLGIIRSHLDDSGFSVEQLNREMGISNTQLFQKLKALTDLSANQLIRKVRLEKAKELLHTTELNIAEIAYETGFSDPAYFARIFSKEEGVTPSEFKNR